MNLQEKHLEAIEDNICVCRDGDYPYLDGKKESSQASTQITKDYMKRFTEWMFKNTIYNSSPKIYCRITENLHSFDELIEIFLNNENKQQ